MTFYKKVKSPECTQSARLCAVSDINDLSEMIGCILQGHKNLLFIHGEELTIF